MTLGWLCVAALVACVRGIDPANRNTTSPPDKVVYVRDDRHDVCDFADERFKKIARESVAALIYESSLVLENGRYDQELMKYRPIGIRRHLCSDQRFFNQPTAAECSATLVAPDRMITAGHCITVAYCRQRKFVFNYYLDSSPNGKDCSMPQITPDDVYSCTNFERIETDQMDWALVRLDRSVVGRKPVAVNLRRTPLAMHQRLAVIGYGSGLPVKIDTGGFVLDPRASTVDYFLANTDTFAGNSGSGVFDTNSVMVGLLVRGQTDYIQRGGCSIVNVVGCANEYCTGHKDVEEITYVWRPMAAMVDCHAHMECPQTMSCERRCPINDDSCTGWCVRGRISAFPSPSPSPKFASESVRESFTASSSVTSSPTWSLSKTQTITSSASASGSVSQSVLPSQSNSPSPTTSETSSSSATLSSSQTLTITSSASASKSVSESASGTLDPSQSAFPSQTLTTTSSASASESVSESVSGTLGPSQSALQSQSDSPSSSPTTSETSSSSATLSSSQTLTITSSASASESVSESVSGTLEPSQSALPSQSDAPSSSLTTSESSSSSATLSSSQTLTITSSASASESVSASVSGTQDPSHSDSPSASLTTSETSSSSVTESSLASATESVSESASVAPESSGLAAPSRSDSPSATPTGTSLIVAPSVENSSSSPSTGPSSSETLEPSLSKTNSSSTSTLVSPTNSRTLAKSPSNTETPTPTSAMPSQTSSSSVSSSLTTSETIASRATTPSSTPSSISSWSTLSGVFAHPLTLAVATPAALVFCVCACVLCRRCLCLKAVVPTKLKDVQQVEVPQQKNWSQATAVDSGELGKNLGAVDSLGRDLSGARRMRAILGLRDGNQRRRLLDLADADPEDDIVTVDFEKSDIGSRHNRQSVYWRRGALLED